MEMFIYILYIVFTAFIVFLCIWNFFKSRNLQEEILYVVLAVPFILRVLQIK
jgi:type II secretory pathway component PulF